MSAHNIHVGFYVKQENYYTSAILYTCLTQGSDFTEDLFGDNSRIIFLFYIETYMYAVGTHLGKIHCIISGFSHHKLQGGSSLRQIVP